MPCQPQNEVKPVLVPSARSWIAFGRVIAQQSTRPTDTTPASRSTTSDLAPLFRTCATRAAHARRRQQLLRLLCGDCAAAAAAAQAAAQRSLQSVAFSGLEGLCTRVRPAGHLWA